MKKLIIAFVFAALPGLAAAAGGGIPGPANQHANVNVNDKASLQRGAQLFVNYCLSCHSAAYMRYNRMGDDLEIGNGDPELRDALLKENLMFTTEKVGDTMVAAIDPADAAKWFGKLPPDLSVTARARGADWVYAYLRSFYIDESRPLGVNNTVLVGAGMPHVLWELQGMQRAVVEETVDENGDTHSHIVDFEIVEPGKMTPAEYNEAARDLTNFMVYMAEPAQLKRTALGWPVLGFLFILFIFAYMLKKEYWKDIH